MADKKQISCYIEDDSHRGLMELEKQTHIGYQTHIRLAIRQYLGREESKPQNKQINAALKNAGLK